MLNPTLKERFEREVRSHPIVIYMKGNQDFPRCGFSARVVELLDRHGPLFTVDVLADPEVREGIKEFTSWPTIPQVFIHGEFIGGCDIVSELSAKGELPKLFTKKT